ncbi:hypothetical protein KCP78_12515 [Salmonella enterica subsp. enterica]|nr:hypothetical protein KCP78_12515 [Salmonella enterica subsp. enterica]
MKFDEPTVRGNPYRRTGNRLRKTFVKTCYRRDDSVILLAEVHGLPFQAQGVLLSQEVRMLKRENATSSLPTACRSCGGHGAVKKYVAVIIEPDRPPKHRHQPARDAVCSPSVRPTNTLALSGQAPRYGGCELR